MRVVALPPVGVNATLIDRVSLCFFLYVFFAFAVSLNASGTTPAALTFLLMVVNGAAVRAATAARLLEPPGVTVSDPPLGTKI